MKTVADQLCRGVLNSANVKVLAVVSTHVANEGRSRHGLTGIASAMLSQNLTAGLLMGALHKGQQRVNLQIECDGPLRGLLVDAGADGTVRGYVKNALLRIDLGDGEFKWRPALGNKGFLSVLRDVGHEYYRSSVELKAMAPADDLNFYFDTSEQVATRLAVEVMHHEDGEVGVAAGVLLQALPDGDGALVHRLGATLQDALVKPMREFGVGLTAEQLAQAIFSAYELQVLEVSPVQWRCTCSRERVIDTLSSLGKAEVTDMLVKDGQASVTCAFCNTTHVATAADLTAILARLDAAPSA